MKSILISINPKWCELIASGKKIVEVRKTKPKLDIPFKCYIYCTKGELLTRSNYNGKIYVASSPKYQKALERNGNITLSGKVIGEFICDKIDRLAVCGYDNSDMKLRRVDDNLTAYNLDYDYLNKCRLSLGELKNYSNGSKLFGWHISDLVIYDKPKELSDFRKPCIYGEESDVSCFLCDKSGYRPDMHIDCFNEVTTPPQSWCYVEEVEK